MTVYQSTIDRHRKTCPSRLGEMLQSAIKLRATRPSAELQERIEALQHLLDTRAAPRRKPPRVSRHRLPRPFASWQPVIDDCCRRHGISRRELFMGFKDARVVPCRFEIWWTLHKVHGVSMNRIGERMGGYHHTSVLHGVRRWQAQLDAKRASSKVAA